jgi:hypothetical protein
VVVVVRMHIVQLSFLHAVSRAGWRARIQHFAPVLARVVVVRMHIVQLSLHSSCLSPFFMHVVLRGRARIQHLAPVLARMVVVSGGAVCLINACPLYFLCSATRSSRW